MDTLRVIPQVFFDLIARVVPGALAIILLGAALPGKWTALSATLKGGPKVVSESATLWVLALLVLSFALGHLLAPLGKLLQRLYPPADVIEPLFTNKPEASQKLVKFVKSQLGDPPSYEAHFEKEIWIWYDWLRVFVPSAGSLSARIRAEYTMYSSLAVAFAIAFLVRVLSAIRKPDLLFDISFLVVTGGIALLMFLRWRESELTFRRSVRNFYFAARDCVDPQWQVSSTSPATQAGA